MQDKLPVSILIPTYNMAHHLDLLLSSITSSGLAEAAQDIVVVNDGSTDGTSAVIRKWPNVRELKLEENRGRFWARFEGAKTIKTERILFLDTRLTVDKNFPQGLKGAIERGGSCVGWVDIDVSKNIFCLYWQRSHEYIFDFHFSHSKTCTEVKVGDYDRFLKGTGVFVCNTKDFVDVCSDLSVLEVKSDDTLLIKNLLHKGRLYIDPKLVIHWELRDSYKDFLARIIDRGPGFVEYHILERKGLFFYISLIMILSTLSWVIITVKNPQFGFNVAAAILLILALTGRLFAKSWDEWMKIALLHTLVILSFVVGLFYGLGFHTLNKLGRHTPHTQKH